VDCVALKSSNMKWMKVEPNDTKDSVSEVEMCVLGLTW
jgi:hypothetical protein